MVFEAAATDGAGDAILLGGGTGVKKSSLLVLTAIAGVGVV